jgi:hypothetical protein
MRYVIAIVISIALILSMFGFVAFMDMKEHQWKAANTTLAPIALGACCLDHFLHHYWYLFIPLLTAIPFSFAAILPKRK